MKKMRKDDKTGEAMFVQQKAEKANASKQRKMMENQNIALVNMKRTIESKKAERLRKNLHMLDFQQNESRIEFVSDISQVKSHGVSTNYTGEELEKSLGISAEKESAFIQEVKRAQSMNKGQYNKLADALVKEDQLNKVSEALTLDKMLKQKGKKRKIEDQNTGRVSYKWFSERKK